MWSLLLQTWANLMQSWSLHSEKCLKLECLSELSKPLSSAIFDWQFHDISHISCFHSEHSLSIRQLLHSIYYSKRCSRQKTRPKRYMHNWNDIKIWHLPFLCNQYTREVGFFGCFYLYEDKPSSWDLSTPEFGDKLELYLTL